MRVVPISVDTVITRPLVVEHRKRCGLGAYSPELPAAGEPAHAIAHKAEELLPDCPANQPGASANQPDA
jgi:hypothetical protein